MLGRLMAADGLHASITELAWRNFVEYVAETLDIGPGTRVFEVDCGGGSFLSRCTKTAMSSAGSIAHPI